MTHEEVVAACKKAHEVGTVKHADYVDYVVTLPAHRKSGDEWQTVEQAYLSVDGTLRVAMANHDHRNQGKRLDFADPRVLVDDAEQITLLVTITSEIYGTRHGIATSRKKNGTKAEREFAWEVAETSAIGRALAAMGYGLLPGAGVEAERMLRVNDSPARESGNGHGNHICAMHQVALERRGNGWAHRIKGGGWFTANAMVPTNRSPHDPTEVEI